MKVTPFRGIRYNQRIVGDLTQVLCPPYDVITLEQQKLYYEKSSYNAIRLEFPKCAGGSPDYNGAAMNFRKWLKDEVLQLDSVSSFYLHDHGFEYSGKKRVRRGVIARIKLEPWGSGMYPHEETFSKAKSDRLQLLRACRANFSPLLSLYHDPEQRIGPLLSEASRAKPVVEAIIPSSEITKGQNESGETLTLWAITDPEIKQVLSQLLSSQSFYIADGHHRYETALAYQQERAEGKSLTGKEAFQYVMMELVDFFDPGLVILPIHRLVRGITSSTLMRLEAQLRDFFILESVTLKANSPEWPGLPDDCCLGILGLQPNKLVVLRRRPDISLETIMPGNRSWVYHEFGISILNHIILDKILNITSKKDIAYTVDVKDAYQQIEEGKYQLAALVKSPKPEMVKFIADAQDRMPSKSTYFYPKICAGLIINPLE